MKSTPTPISALPEELVEFNRERVKNHLSQAIFELMDSHGLSRTQFAAMLNVGKSRVTQLLSGCENLSAETLADILLVFGRTPYLTLGVDPYEIRFPVDEGDAMDAATSTTVSEDFTASRGRPISMRIGDYLGLSTDVITDSPKAVRV